MDVDFGTMNHCDVVLGILYSVVTYCAIPNHPYSMIPIIMLIQYIQLPPSPHPSSTTHSKNK